ncbi:hypothetical protein GQ55_5G353900 [Panicum hallii var. hallii]|uniref:Uncharacterized protein n=1 Tax=Panicum hallii var. hallii TaxID=1504633 RepID=A0A2T7DMA6_9POAL|nr:hypothetical protein GQ55_5G353900 [Panicum hallii var. hallii]
MPLVTRYSPLEPPILVACSRCLYYPSSWRNHRNQVLNFVVDSEGVLKIWLFVSNSKEAYICSYVDPHLGKRKKSFVFVCLLCSC